MAATDVQSLVIQLFGFSTSTKLGAHKSFFVSRRAGELVLNNPSWGAEPKLQSLQARLTNERARSRAT